MENNEKYTNFNGNPAFKVKNIPITIASSDEYSPFLGVLIQSIIDNSSKEWNYDIVVLSKSIREFNRVLLNREIEGHHNFSIRYFDITDYLSKYKFHTDYHITIMTYSRLAMIDIFKNYDKVIYLDCDVIINDDIAKLFNIDLGGNFVAAARDTVIAGIVNLDKKAEDLIEDKIRLEQLSYNTNTLGVKNPTQYFNAGIIVVNLQEIKKVYQGEDLLKIAASRDWKWFDQDVLNKICYSKTVILPQAWNVMSHDWNREGIATEKLAPDDILEEYNIARKQPKAIHYCGHCIPCFSPCVDNAEKFWAYAKKTEFYERILFTMMSTATYSIISGGQLSFIRRLADKLLPKGSIRREILKKIMPRGSWQFEFLKKMYHKFTI